MRLLCRKSLEQHVVTIAEDWFRVTKAGIRYYEEIFSTKYPFGKFDQVFTDEYCTSKTSTKPVCSY